MFVATCLERGPGLLVDHAGQQVVGELLGLGQASLHDTVTKLAGTADARAQVLLLGMVVAAHSRVAPRKTRGATRQEAISPRPAPPNISRS